MSASPPSISSTGRMLATCRKATCSNSPGVDAAVVAAVAAEVVAGAAAGAVAAVAAAPAGDGAAGAELRPLRAASRAPA